MELISILTFAGVIGTLGILFFKIGNDLGKIETRLAKSIQDIAQLQRDTEALSNSQKEQVSNQETNLKTLIAKVDEQQNTLNAAREAFRRR